MKKSFLHLLLMLSCVAAALMSCDREEPPLQEDPVVPETPEPPDVELVEPVDPGWETASDAVAAMGVGWNLGNTLDTHIDNGHDGADWRYWETGWGQVVTTPELVRMMKDAGFGAIRVPVTWGIHTDSSGKVFDAWMNRVHEVVGYVLDAGMYCILNVHHDTGADESAWLMADPAVYTAQKARFEYLWKQIAEEFKGHDHRLLFESYNEMLDSRKSWCFASFNGGYNEAFALAAYDAIDSYAQSFVDVVRGTGGNNIARNLIVNTYGACSGSGTWNPHLKDPLKYMSMPEDIFEDHIIFEVHAYPSIADMDAMKAEVDDMFEALENHLESKGAPVIIGEWGTSTENPSKDMLVPFADYFVRKAKECGMGTYFWMGLSDASARSLPAFNQPEVARAIAEAWHGDSSAFSYPTLDDYECSYHTTYTTQWAELNLCGNPVMTSEYSGIRFKLDPDPGEGNLSVKIYGQSDDKVSYNAVTSSEGVIMFDPDILGSRINRITLQYMKTGTFTVDVVEAALIRVDGKEERTVISPFWGCEVRLDAVLKN